MVSLTLPHSLTFRRRSHNLGQGSYKEDFATESAYITVVRLWLSVSAIPAADLPELARLLTNPLVKIAQKGPPASRTEAQSGRQNTRNSAIGNSAAGALK